MGAIALSSFAIAICLIEISCSKTKAQQNRPLSPTSQLNKIIFIKRNPTTSNQPQIWITNYDGSGLTQIPVALPSGVYVSYDLNTVSVKLSPDGQTVLFSAYDQNSNKNGIYLCNIDGSNVTKIVEGLPNESVMLGGAY